MASISEYVNSLLEDYKDLRGKGRNSGRSPFWDVVVITTADAAQRTAFELQIEDKRSRLELPVDLPIHVVSDPPGPRVGNGGSTLTVLESLYSVYGRELFSLKTFLIHAGGWSQRMPSSSALGKIFSVIPHGSPPFQMLDLKLALYWPFVEKIQPGFFLACADDFSVHNLGFDKSWEILGTGFTALAHPSPMSLGRSHGVYVLANPKAVDTCKHVVSMECVEVLQKPNDARMMRQGALLDGQHHTFADGITLDGYVCYTDSCFYFGVDVMKKLLEFKQEVGDLNCEIDAYGDFLQALGKNADASYIQNTSNVSQITPNLLDTRRKVFDLLHDFSVNVLVLNASAYIHIGTAKELLLHMCRDPDFQSKLCVEKDAFNAWTNDQERNGNAQDKSRQDSEPDNMSQFACVIHSLMPKHSLIGDDSYVEFCDFHIPVHIIGQSIVSNCQVVTSEAVDSSIQVPSSTFLHTMPILTSEHTDPEYVTVVFNTEDDIKKSISSCEVMSLPFLGDTIDSYLSSCDLKVSDILPRKKSTSTRKIDGINGKVSTNGSGLVDTNDEENKDYPVSLWSLKLYPSRKTMTSSFKTAADLKLGRISLREDAMSQRLYSLADLIQLKDVKTMLAYRKTLQEKIKCQAR